MKGSDLSRKKASNRVVCGSRQVSVYEMRERNQIYEDAQKMYTTKIPVKKFGKMEKTTFGRQRPGKKKRQAGRGSDMVQKVFRICEAKNGT